MLNYTRSAQHSDVLRLNRSQRTTTGYLIKWFSTYFNKEPYLLDQQSKV